MLPLNLEQIKKIESILNSEVEAIEKLMLEEDPAKPDYQTRMAKKYGARDSLRQLIPNLLRKLEKERKI